MQARKTVRSVTKNRTHNRAQFVPSRHNGAYHGKTNMQNNMLERIPAAARRMAVSTSQVYREIKAARLGPLVKLGPRASAVPSSSVDAWIAARIAEATKGGAQ